MYSLYANDDDVSYGIKKFVLDSEEDVDILPTNIKAGSSALVIGTSQFYMLNNQKEWVEVTNTQNISSFLEWQAF